MEERPVRADAWDEETDLLVGPRLTNHPSRHAYRLAGRDPLPYAPPPTTRLTIHRPLADNNRGPWVNQGAPVGMKHREG